MDQLRRAGRELAVNLCSLTTDIFYLSLTFILPFTAILMVWAALVMVTSVVLLAVGLEGLVGVALTYAISLPATWALVKFINRRWLLMDRWQSYIGSQL